MQTESIARSPIPIQFPSTSVVTPAPTLVPRARRRPHDTLRALEALGQLAGATDRHCLPDALVAWRQYCQAMNREDLLRVPQRFPAVTVLLTVREQEAWGYLSGLAQATARNVNAVDAERHWQSAASAFMQAAANAAAYEGRRVAHALTEWERVDWTDEDAQALDEIGIDLLVAGARRAARYAAIVTGDAARLFSDANCATHRAHSTVQREIDEALRGAGLLVSANRPGWDDDRLLTCTLCDCQDGHLSTCALDALSSLGLVHLYLDTLAGGGR